jgi:predicted enzyme related to lactoylglutathione lyase
MAVAPAHELEVETKAAPKAVVALLKVQDVQRSIDFYEKLGFELGNEPLKDNDGVKTFAWMHRGSSAQIMLTRTARPLNPGAQDVMFYLYVSDMRVYREQVVSCGVAAGEVTYPFWSPNGEFRVDDPDGWTWMIC